MLNKIRENDHWKDIQFLQTSGEEGAVYLLWEKFPECVVAEKDTLNYVPEHETHQAM